MTLAYLLLTTGLIISSVAIYYSVVGLTAIFSAAAIPIIIMGVSLEVAKLVCATWIKQNWARVPFLMKTYMCVAVAVLMLITSMGIFGFLSKAHSDQSLVSGDVGSKLAIFDEKIKTARDNIDAGRKQLKQMDEAVDQVMSRSQDEKGADKAVAIRRGQAKDRASIARDIESNQKIISQLNDEAAPIRAENRKVEAEVGPIKYIAALLYGVEPDATTLEKAVTWIIIMIVIVFDPLAIIMLLAAQMTFAWHNGTVPGPTPKANTPKFLDRLRNRFKKPEEEIKLADLDAVDMDALNRELRDSYEPAESIVIEELTPDEINRINQLAAEYAEPVEPDYTDYSEGHAIEPEPEPVVEKKSMWSGFGFPLTSYFGQPKQSEPEPIVEAPFVPEPIPFSGKMYTFASDPVTGKPLLDQPLAVKDITEEEFKEFQAKMEQPAVEAPVEPNPLAMDERPGDYVEPVAPVVQQRIPEAVPGRNRGVMNPKLVAQADNATPLGKPSNTGFGNEFPANPDKGDLYLRTDFLPNRLYKFNEKKWIEVDKDATDVYAYNEMYIKHLIEQIESGKYDIDSLSDVEREQIKQYLEKNAQ